MINNETPIILFDGVCNLCNSTVLFLIKRDPKGILKFSTLQSESGQELLHKFGLESSDFDSFVLIKGVNYYLKSTAALYVLKELGGMYKLFHYFIIVPRPLRDFIYNCIAKSRYRIFGKRKNCMLPSPEIEQRFLN